MTESAGGIYIHQQPQAGLTESGGKRIRTGRSAPVENDADQTAAIMTNERPWEILENGSGPWKRLLLVDGGGGGPAVLIQPQLVPLANNAASGH